MDLIKYSYKELFAQELSQTDFAEYTKEVTIYCSPILMPSEGMTVNGVDINFVPNIEQTEFVKVMVKFNGTVAYNITSYFGNYLDGNLIANNSREREEDAVKLATAIQQSLKNASHKFRDLYNNNPRHLKQNTRHLSITNGSHAKQLMRDNEYYSHGTVVFSDYGNQYQMYEYLYALVTDAKIVVPSSQDYILFVSNDNMYSLEGDENYTVVSSYGSGVVAVNDTVLNYIRYYMPKLYVNQCDVTDIFYTTASERVNHGQYYHLIREDTGYRFQANILDQNSVLPHLIDIAIGEDDYCSECDTTLTYITDDALFNDLDEYVDMMELINTDGEHSNLCISCADRQRDEYEKFNNLISYKGNTMTFNGKTYPRYVYDDGIEDYDYEPYFQMFGEGLHLGAEIEVDKGGESNLACNIACNIMSYDNNVFTYGMHDGSLNDGFEIGTMPATLDVHKQVAYKDAFQFLTSSGYRAHDTDTCGIHIHFDRSFLGATHQTINTKVAYLTYILEHNWEKVKKFTRRNYHELNRWAPKKDLLQDIYADDDEEAIVSKWRSKYDNDKYVAVNTQHSNSIELRIFRGTLDYNSYMSILEFVDNLVHLTKGITNITQAQQVTFADIINYKPTDYLVAYCQERGII